MIVLVGAWSFYRNELAPYSMNDMAAVRWMPGGRQNVVMCLVTTTDGLPLRGRSVHIDNSSGANTITTDTNGWATCGMGEPEVLGNRINDVQVLSRPRADLFDEPDCRNGLIVVVELKESALRAMHLKP